MLLTKLTTALAVEYLSAVVRLSSYQTNHPSETRKHITDTDTLQCGIICLEQVYFLSTVFAHLY